MLFLQPLQRLILYQLKLLQQNAESVEATDEGGAETGGSKEYNDIFVKNLFLQFEFKTQWQKIKSYANNNNVRILGDIPIYEKNNDWLDLG